jgi:hypothetical protein
MRICHKIYREQIWTINMKKSFIIEILLYKLNCKEKIMICIVSCEYIIIIHLAIRVRVMVLTNPHCFVGFLHFLANLHGNNFIDLLSSPGQKAKWAFSITVCPLLTFSHLVKLTETWYQWQVLYENGSFQECNLRYWINITCFNLIINIVQDTFIWVILE